MSGARAGRVVWTHEEIETIEDLRLAGWDWNVIGRRLGRSPKACQSQAVLHGIRLDDEARRLMQQRRDEQAIAAYRRRRADEAAAELRAAIEDAVANRDSSPLLRLSVAERERFLRRT